MLEELEKNIQRTIAEFLAEMLHRVIEIDVNEWRYVNAEMA